MTRTLSLSLSLSLLLTHTHKQSLSLSHTPAHTLLSLSLFLSHTLPMQARVGAIASEARARDEEAAKHQVCCESACVCVSDSV